MYFGAGLIVINDERHELRGKGCYFLNLRPTDRTTFSLRNRLQLSQDEISILSGVAKTKKENALDETSLETIVLLANSMGYELALVKKKDYLGDMDHSQVEEENH